MVACPISRVSPSHWFFLNLACWHIDMLLSELLCLLSFPQNALTSFLLGLDSGKLPLQVHKSKVRKGHQQGGWIRQFSPNYWNSLFWNWTPLSLDLVNKAEGCIGADFRGIWASMQTNQLLWEVMVEHTCSWCTGADGHPLTEQATQPIQENRL